jgi:hypothetical protein
MRESGYSSSTFETISVDLPKGNVMSLSYSAWKRAENQQFLVGQQSRDNSSSSCSRILVVKNLQMKNLLVFLRNNPDKKRK